MFYNCTSLTSLEIPGSVDVIGDHTFEGCTGLTSVTFADGEGSLIIGFNPNTDERGPFYDSPLTEITLNRNLAMTEAYTKAADDYDEGIFSCHKFSDSSHRTTLEIGSSVKEILPYMFAGSGITSVEIPANVSAVGYNAFLYCYNLKEVSIPEASTPLTFGYQYYKSADWGPFYDSPLEKVSFNRDINFVDKNGQTFTADDWDEGVFATKNGTLSSISIGTGVTKILPYMFAESNATSVWIPHTIKTIGNNAFDNCDELRGVTLGFDGQLGFYRPSIGEDVFDDCDRLDATDYKFYIKVRESVLNRFITNDSNDEWFEYKNWIVTGPFE